MAFRKDGQCQNTGNAISFLTKVSPLSSEEFNTDTDRGGGMQRQVLFCGILFSFCMFAATLFLNVTPAIAFEDSSRLLFQNLAENKEENELLRHARLLWEGTSLEPRSENIAFYSSLLSTFVPIAVGGTMVAAQKPDTAFAFDLLLIATGAVFGPATGYFYADCNTRGSIGVGIRILLVAALYPALFISIRSQTENSNDDLEDHPFFSTAGYIGAGLLVFDIIYDIANVKSVVRKRNLSLKQRTLIIAPEYYARWEAIGIMTHLSF